MVAFVSAGPTRDDVRPSPRPLPAHLSSAPSAVSADRPSSPDEELATAWQSPPVLKMIGRLAVRWSLDTPDLREDLFQEGWLAAWQAELREPGCPASHLVRCAEERMVYVRRLGRSVDGKPNARHDRPHPFEVLPLDRPARVGDDDARALV